jgi:TrkA domain protein
MQVIHTTVPGVGVMHDLSTRDGQQFRLLVEESGIQLFVYGSADEPVTTVALERDEADVVADLLHSKPIPDRMADLERRFAEIAGRAR